MPANHVTHITNTLADTQQQQQARKANTPQALPQAGRPRNAPAPAAGDVTVTLSAEGRRAAATASETANAVNAAAAHENANRVANNNAVRQNPPQPQQQTQKTINRIGGTA
jgi:hypothetical protein